MSTNCFLRLPPPSNAAGPVLSKRVRIKGKNECGEASVFRLPWWRWSLPEKVENNEGEKIYLSRESEGKVVVAAKEGSRSVNVTEGRSSSRGPEFMPPSAPSYPSSSIHK